MVKQWYSSKDVNRPPSPLPPTDFSRGPCGMTPPENSPVGCGGGGGGRGAGRRGSFLSILPSSCLLAQVQVHSTGHCDLVISGQCYAAPSGSCRVSQSLCAFPQARPGHRSSGGFCPGQWTGSFTPLPPPAPLCPPQVFRMSGCRVGSKWWPRFSTDHRAEAWGMRRAQYGFPVSLRSTHTLWGPCFVFLTCHMRKQCPDFFREREGAVSLLQGL